MMSTAASFKGTIDLAGDPFLTHQPTKPVVREQKSQPLPPPKPPESGLELQGGGPPDFLEIAIASSLTHIVMSFSMAFAYFFFPLLPAFLAMIMSGFGMYSGW